MHIPPDWGTFGALIVSFLVFWFIFGRLFFGPFLKVLSDRERRLRELGERTEQLLRDEKAAVETREAERTAVRTAALRRRAEERRQTEAEAARIIEQARDAAKAELDRVRQRIEEEFAAAARQLEELAETLATELAERVLGRAVSDGRAMLHG